MPEKEKRIREGKQQISQKQSTKRTSEGSSSWAAFDASVFWPLLATS